MQQESVFLEIFSLNFDDQLRKFVTDLLLCLRALVFDNYHKYTLTLYDEEVGYLR